MVATGSKGDIVPAGALLEALEDVRSLQQCILKADARLQQVEIVTKDVVDTHKQLDDKMDGIYKLIQQWNSSSEYGSHEKPPKPFPNPPSSNTSKIPLHTAPYQSFESIASASSTVASLTFNIPNPHTNTQPGTIYTHLFPNTSALHTPNNTTNPYTNTPPNPSASPPHFHTLELNRQQSRNNFSLNVAHPKLDFPTFSRDEPVNWLRQ
jgi:hypothetical protein